MSVRALGSSVFGWPIWASIGAHGVALAAAATAVTLPPSATPSAPVPIEVVRLDAPAPPPPPPPPPRREPRRVVRPSVREPVTPPRLVPQAARVIEQTEATPALLHDAPGRESAAPVEAPADNGRRFLAGASSSSFALPGPSGGSAKGAGKLFSTGDLPIPGLSGASGKGSGAGGEGKGTDGPQVASKGNPDGLTSFARPVGGYQTRPRYPDSARRQGIEGETLLRFQVLPTGRVASVSVARSAGHPDLDRSAVEAVETWLFEPARRGKEAVAVWVTLPVRFQLQSGVGD
jgi:protein TonB